jgi:hypothetical protein
MSYNNRVWQGNMKLCNVASYLADNLRVPVAAIDLKFKWVSPNDNKMKVLEGADLHRPVRDLRTLWQ